LSVAQVLLSVDGTTMNHVPPRGACVKPRRALATPTGQTPFIVGRTRPLTGRR
jgi:hypothetical protein